MTDTIWTLRFGAGVEADGVRFRVWAPKLDRLDVVISDSPPRILPMHPEGDGEFVLLAEGCTAGCDYMLRLGSGRDLPDPVSRWLPYGVHGPSRVVDPGSFPWSDEAWRGIPLRDYLIYELHTGTFTPEGSFECVIPRLASLRDLGITAIELMPVAEFPGRRNWGYDGVGLYAPQSSYGGPAGLKTLIDACHRQGLAVVLDVVYNHLGPEGNYLAEFAPFFTGRYRTPWGDAINYDGPESDGVRRFFVDNALYWLTEYHLDALRLDAIQGIFDHGARHFLRELADSFHAQASRLGRAAFLIAESDLNDVRVIAPPDIGGYGVDAQWHDDFHHSLYTAFFQDRRGYFSDFNGLPSLAKAITEGFVYSGQHSRYRRRRHGSSSSGRPGEHFVVCSENHDQVANGLCGIRLSRLLSPAQQKLAAALVVCAPFLPLLFMGQEYGEESGFYYFTDHGDPALAEAVREGRRKEASAFQANGEFLDPQDPGTFERSRLCWNLRAYEPHSGLMAWYRGLIALRRQTPALRNCRMDLVRVAYNNGHCPWFVVERSDPSAGPRALLVCNFSARPQAIPILGADLDWGLQLRSGHARASAGTVELSEWAAAVYLSG